MHAFNTRPLWAVGFLFIVMASATVLAQPALKIDPTQEASTLANIRQLTNEGMGFTKAGEAYFSPDGKKVIFQAVPKEEQHYQIYTIPTAGGKPKRVSTGRGACTCAFFHPTKDRILFASTHEDPRIADPDAEFPVPGYKREGGNYRWDFNPYMEIYQANADGSSLVKLTDALGYDAEGAYSKDGKTIAFASNRTGHMNIYTMNADGTNVKQVTHADGCYNGGPFLSPDGKRIVFRADRDRKDYLEIYVINVDGTGEVKLTTNDAVNWAPYWHPNGKTIVFTTSLHGHSNYEVYLMNVDTRTFRRVTHSRKFDGLPVFSNDGKMLMWTSQRGPGGASHVFVADFKLPDGF